MLMTGLVSLNVHEPLTFEGTEICLHPDLFANTTTDSFTVAAASARHSVMSAASKDGQQQRLSLIPTASSEDFGSTASQGKLLQVGDMVEIRVWDPLPRSSQHATSSNASSVLRKRPSPPMSAQSSTSESQTDERVSSVLTGTKEALEAAASSLKSSTFSRGGASSLQYSVDSVADPIVEEGAEAVVQESFSREMDALTISSDEPLPTTISDAVAPLASLGPGPLLSPGGEGSGVSKTVITSGDLPPVFPRSRTNTADAGPTTNSVRMPSTAKPPIAQRRTSAPVESTFKTSSRPSHSVPGSHGKTRHHRDLSDMTADTFYGVDPTKATTLDNTHQLLDLQLPLSNFDDDEDMWTHISSANTLRLSFVVKVTEKSLTSLKGSGRTQVSLLRHVADLYELKTYDTVTIHKIDKEEEAAVLKAVSADFVLVTIKDQFISRGDMHYFQQTLIGSWIYEGQRLTEPTRGVQANAWEIRHGDHQARSGIVTDDTMFAFRSRSARIFWLVQMSVEMWDYASPYERNQDESVCELYFEKWISFIHELFAKWKELEATHSLTVVFFSRTFLSSGSAVHRAEEKSPLDQKDVYGRQYEDHYKIVIEKETSADWDSLVVRIKKAFLNYPREVGWKLSGEDTIRRPSTASQGNVLEAINVTLNLLQFHYLDRDLHRTGNSVVVVSAGNGVFEVDKGLASITYQRMMDNGIGSDMLSLNLPPLHIAPFFLYVNDYQSVETGGIDAGETYYEVPHWMHLSFVSYESDSALIGDRNANEAMQSPRSRNIPADLEVAPNGFLLPTAGHYNGPFASTAVDTSPVLRASTSFSVLGNAAASPVKKRKAITQERQLISGRDFRDILEACRPRHVGLLPSALKALLRIYGKPDDKAADEQESEKEQSALSEWGTLNFEDKVESTAHDRLLQEAEAIDRSSPLLDSGAPTFVRSLPRVDARSLPRVDALLRSGFAEKTSPSSSYASSSALGVSYDRPFLAHQASPTLTGIQLQRAPSLDFELPNDDDSETVLSEDGSLDLGSNERGYSSVGEGNESASRKQKTGDSFAKNLSVLMRDHDSAIFAQPSSPKLNASADLNRSQHGELHSVRSGRGPVGASSTRGPFSQHLRSPGRKGLTSGGIGAALTHYSGGPGVPAPGDIEFEQPVRLSRGNSMLPIPHGHFQVPGGDSLLASRGMQGRSLGRFQSPEMTSRGISPLLLPPTVSIANADLLGIRGDSSSRLRPPELSRLVHPHELSIHGQNELRGSGQIGVLAKGSVNTRLDSQGIRHGNSRVRGNSRGVSTSPPMAGLAFSGSLKRLEVGGQLQRSGRDPGTTRPVLRRKKAFNPFRQQDEDEVLAKKSHNRRRWSHVFPLGEVEFKRHAGPNWKSLCSPAVLPLSVDYFPPQQEIDQFYTFGTSNVTLSEFEKTHYSSNKDLLMEMVRQRLTQDYQLVPPSHVNASNYRRESLKDGLANRQSTKSVRDNNPEVNRQFLSMGHRLQVLTYDPTSDFVEVTRYDAKSAQQSTAMNSFKYNYLAFCQETQSYTKVVQTFKKYSDEYRWGAVDRIICGNEDKELREAMRPRRIMFGLVPDRFEGNVGAEQEYITKFLRLLEYLNKLRGKDESSSDLNIKIVSSIDKKGKPTDSTPGLSRNSMKRFYVQLRKGKQDLFEWMEVVLDATFDTSWSYRVIFNWLVASSGKIDAQVQLLQRRCNQYGLNLVPFPQITVAQNLYLNPFKAPAILTVRDKGKAGRLNTAILQSAFVYDGVFSTDTDIIVDCIDDGDQFDFGKRMSMPSLGHQYVHRSGTLFVRHLTARNGFAVLVAFGNDRISKAETTKESARAAFNDLRKCIDSLTTSDD